MSVDLGRITLRQANKARYGQRLPTSFLTKRLNIWTRAAQQWIHPDKWRGAAGPRCSDPAALAGRTCYAGLDLSNTTDITAWVLVFPPTPEDDRWYVLPRWIPEDAMNERSRRNKVPYDAWCKAGLIEVISGEVIDYEFIYRQIDKDAQIYDVREAAFDRWGVATIYLWFANRGMTAVQIGQGYVSLSAPSKELEKLVLGRRLAHGDNPVLTWMMHNTVITTDPGTLIKPARSSLPKRLTGLWRW